MTLLTAAEWKAMYTCCREKRWLVYRRGHDWLHTCVFGQARRMIQSLANADALSTEKLDAVLACRIFEHAQCSHIEFVLETAMSRPQD